MNLTRRPRRLRRTAQIRNLVHEVDVRCDDLIYPVFVTEGENVQSPIESMPGIYHYSLDRLAIHLKEVWEKGVLPLLSFISRSARYSKSNCTSSMFLLAMASIIGYTL